MHQQHLPVGFENSINYYNFYYHYNPDYPDMFDDYYGRTPAAALNVGFTGNMHNNVRLPRGADKGPRPFTDEHKRDKRDCVSFLHDVFSWSKLHNVSPAYAIKFFLEGTVREDWDRQTARHVPVEELEESTVPNMTWKEVCSTFRMIVGADLDDEFFTSAKSMVGSNPDIAMKSTEKVNDYILRFRAVLQKVGESELGSKMQVFMFTQNLVAELREECAVQADGTSWPNLQAAINAALGAQKRLHASQPVKRAKLAAVHTVAHDSDAAELFVSAEAQHAAGYPEDFLQDQDHTLAAVHQRRTGQYHNNVQRGSASQQQYGNQQHQHNNQHVHGNSYNRSSNTVNYQHSTGQPATTFGGFKALIRPTLQAKGWCTNCGSHLHSAERCDRTGFLSKLPRFNEDQPRQ